MLIFVITFMLISVDIYFYIAYICLDRYFKVQKKTYSRKLYVLNLNISYEIAYCLKKDFIKTKTFLKL